MKVLSLLDGISISNKNYPQIEHCGDVTTADFKHCEGFDLLIGGSPCQNLSAGNKERQLRRSVLKKAKRPGY